MPPVPTRRYLGIAACVLLSLAGGASAAAQDPIKDLCLSERRRLADFEGELKQLDDYELPKGIDSSARKTPMLEAFVALEARRRRIRDFVVPLKIVLPIDRTGEIRRFCEREALPGCAQAAATSEQALVRYLDGIESLLSEELEQLAPSVVEVRRLREYIELIRGSLARLCAGQPPTELDPPILMSWERPLPVPRHSNGRPIITDELVTRFVRTRCALEHNLDSSYRAGRFSHVDFLQVDGSLYSFTSDKGDFDPWTVAPGDLTAEEKRVILSRRRDLIATANDNLPCEVSDTGVVTALSASPPPPETQASRPPPDAGSTGGAPLPIARRADGLPFMTSDLIRRYLWAQRAAHVSGGAYWRAGSMSQQDLNDVRERIDAYLGTNDRSKLEEMFLPDEMAALDSRRPDLINAREKRFDEGNP